MNALSALLDGLIDYAGLYPPASLAMDQAVRDYAGYRSGPRAAWLARPRASIRSPRSEPRDTSLLAPSNKEVTLLPRVLPITSDDV